MDSLAFYYQVVEKAIARIGLDPQRARKETGKWTLVKRNKIPVWIDVFHNPQEKSSYFMVSAPFLSIPSYEDKGFAWRLLQMNNELYGASFVANNGTIFLKTVRETEGLDVSEAFAMIVRIGHYAEEYKKKFNPAVQQPVGKAQSDVPIG